MASIYIKITKDVLCIFVRLRSFEINANQIFKRTRRSEKAKAECDLVANGASGHRLLL